MSAKREFPHLSVWELLDQWNESNSGARYRNELRVVLGFQENKNKLSDLLRDWVVHELRDNITQQIPSEYDRPSVPVSNTPPGSGMRGDLDLFQEFRDLKRDFIINDAGGGPLARIIATTGWNYVDIRTGSAAIRDKASHELEDFILRIMADNPLYRHMSRGERGFFEMICNAWQEWWLYENPRDNKE